MRQMITSSFQPAETNGWEFGNTHWLLEYLSVVVEGTVYRRADSQIMIWSGRFSVAG